MHAYIHTWTCACSHASAHTCPSTILVFTCSAVLLLLYNIFSGRTLQMPVVDKICIPQKECSLRRQPVMTSFDITQPMHSTQIEHQGTQWQSPLGRSEEFHENVKQTTETPACPVIFKAFSLLRPCPPKALL